MILATLLYRASHVVIAVFAVQRPVSDRPVDWLMLGIAVVCSVLVWGHAVRSGRFSAARVWADVVLVGAGLPVVAVVWGGPVELDSFGWVILLGTSSSAAAGVALGGVEIVGAVLLMGASPLVLCALIHVSPSILGSHLISLVSSGVMAWVFWRYLCRQGRLLDAANARALETEARRARDAERLAHHRALHDTVLATLTALAGGGVDANSPEVRERCAHEAAYLRRLVQRGADEGPGPGLGTALERAVRFAEGLGLRVSAQYQALPEVPPEVATAVSDAVTEALNNVRRHAGTSRAYLTAAGSADGLLVTVVDRGTGFDPRRVVPGVGLRSSIAGRLAEAGGAAQVESMPEEGTRVELRWPA
ncbi:sensor histidine kinase [Streptomyces beihaiensis]|uniref:Histidine kinase/HSP90-like ATPase domain-containing protein n=1 Tax=Streptomyces beihaiensis TaxID=2984495 RepID=A0ABT3TWD7_9ACTN|nr:ATP-binding protein [Streptomyces beihaiensis]MCX3061368.1 hypothetical protein [Streptomyces beihaiensis]